MDATPLRIGDLARSVGVSPDTIRHYERIGLLPKPARTRAGYRQYSRSAIERVMLVRHALRFGFSLRDLARFLRTREAGGAPCREVRAAGERILAAVEQQIAELTAARETIRKTLYAWDQRLAQTERGRPAHLLESLEAENGLPAHFPPSPRKRHA